jgi:carbamate kinase
MSRRFLRDHRRRQDLLVVALGGNALSPPDSGDPGYAVERSRIVATGEHLRALTRQGYRLLIVHGNGPQVGRLLARESDGGNLDVLTAQTQGELGYLLSQAVPDSVSVVTRVTVSEENCPATKAIGPKLSAPPPGGPWVRFQDGFRVAVRSPPPVNIVELDAIRMLLPDFHVIAGGGGGIALNANGQPVAGVVDKDRVASLLAISFDAAALVLATDVDGVYLQYGQPDASRLLDITPDTCDRLLVSGELGAGTMAPKVESATRFVRTCGRFAVICAIGEINEALHGKAGTRITMTPAYPDGEG